MPVAKLNVNFIVTASAKTHEIALVVRPALIHGKDVMYFLNRSRSARFQAYFAKRMFPHIPCPDALPFRAVLLVMLGSTLIFIVIVCHRLPVLIAISAVRKTRTAGKGARLIRFMRHTLLPIEKAHRAFAPQALCNFPRYHYTT